MSAEKEKSVSAALRFLELELDENLTALLVAIALIVISCN
jgi:hypothetical protein